MSYFILLEIRGNLGLRNYFPEYWNVVLMSTPLSLLVPHFSLSLTFISIYIMMYTYSK